jgi:GNAT superfamily N-acetyltransferase
MEMAEFRQVKTKEDLSDVRDLFWEYLQWANARVNQEFGVNFDIETMLEDDMDDVDIYFPPNGRLVLVSKKGKPAGLGCLKKLREGIGEIKRMYVRPEFRGCGLGREILETLISEARDIGYPKVRLDSARFMEVAHSLYRASGFREIEAYDESEIPPEFRKHWIFMEKTLME